MFSYYGSKSKLARLYPKPRYNIIVEPFCGAAWYSSLHYNKGVLLNDLYPPIYNIWNWLINEASQDEIIGNSDFYQGQNIIDLPLTQPHKDLIGFCINRGSVSPKNIVQKWSCQAKGRPDWASTTNYQLRRISDMLPNIRHWQARFGDYRNLPDIEATWFIDPPYQNGGELYSENKIDYSELAEWCLGRSGQVIVCENNQADWLPFSELREITGQRKKTTEVFWTNTPTDDEQLFPL